MKLVFFQVKILPSRIWIEIIMNDRYLKMVRRGKSKCEIQDPGINISLREAPTSLPSLAVSCGKTLSSSSLRQRILFFFFFSSSFFFFFFFPFTIAQRVISSLRALRGVSVNARNSHESAALRQFRGKRKGKPRKKLNGIDDRVSAR